MKIILLTVALMVGFTTAALAQPQGPFWEPCQYSDPGLSSYCG